MSERSAEFEARTVTRFAADGEPLGPAVTLVNIPAPDLRTPEAVTGNIEWNQRFGRRVLFKVNYLKRTRIARVHPRAGSRAAARCAESTGKSRYWEVELTGRYLGGDAPRHHHVVRAVAWRRWT